MKRKSCQFIGGGGGILFASREVCNDSVERFVPPAPVLYGIHLRGVWLFTGCGNILELV